MATTRFKTYNDLVLKIYQAAIEPTLWPEITLETSDLMKSGGTQLLVIDNQTNIENIAVSTRLSDQSQREYLSHYMKNDLRVPALLKKAMLKTGVHSQQALIKWLDRFCFIKMR